MHLIVSLPDDLERDLRERAARLGQPVELYVRHLIERAATLSEGAGPVSAAPERALDPARLSGAGFERLLDELATGSPLPHLPADFARADLYSDHD